MARAAVVTAGLTAAGALFGLVRDQLIAHLFGAGGATDAFLVAWTVPELAATLLIEDAMALALIPAFSLALSLRAAGGTGRADRADPVRRLLAVTAPRLFLALSCGAVLVGLAAPSLVDLLAPGLADPGPAVVCTRLTAMTVLTFGVAGYLSAALRAHHSYPAPAAIYVAYNVGIVATVLTLHATHGVAAAAAGVAVGSCLMVLVQLPAGHRLLPLRLPAASPPLPAPSGPGDQGPLPAASLRARAVLAPVVPIALFALARQSQVLIERHLASGLPAGAISHLNYAQKVAQLPMVLSLMVCTVTFPLVARAMADGEAERARRRVERDLTLAGVVVLAGTAYVIAYAPQIVEVLFQRGAFEARDTAATAAVMRVYALGLLGHSLVGALIRPFCSAGRPTWYPLASMTVGLLATVAAGAATAPHWGVLGIAAANACGISVTALLLLRGLGARLIALRVGRVAAGLGRLALAAAVAAAVGWAAAADATGAPLAPSAPVAVAAGCLLVPVVFAVTALAVRAPEVPELLASAQRKLRHVR
ncbi:virulence factor MviN [Streptomyces sp. LX-29]|uniref:lipid II flippase MurJ n=1 Tax=Streptomyces sp. LX-29 TaxID=2900152 RepID=UPI00240DF216|nr:lipid II flippase MurJ [Streptomyces sp. LX-29]WFB10347.1 virulence factor MviN [Streptomyces sp. LX-29]